jgi:two-component system, NtrC family, response regulator AtoC
MFPRSILVAEDDAVTRLLLKRSLEHAGFSVSVCESGEAALEALGKQTYPVLVSDIRMWGMDGLALIAELKHRKVLTVPILMTGFGSLEGAVEAIRRGAFDYLSKPFRPDELVQTVERAWNHWRGLVEESKRPVSLSAPAVISADEVRFIGRSPAIVNVYKLVARAAMTSSTVLITGESGTGKELVARAIHKNSKRPDGPFIAVNCGAISEPLLESELFGYVRGAFTGATGEKKGLFEESSGGTIFLDEIGDISPAMQVKLLRVLQYGEVKPVGSTETRTLDTRVIAATHRNLSQRVTDGTFREDLYYRLNVISIDIPPLRERRQDIRELAQYFLATFAQRNQRGEMAFTEACFAVLEKYDWPGNIRELEHAVEYAVAMAQGTVLFPESFPDTVLKNRKKLTVMISAPASTSPTGEADTGAETLADSERHHILSVLTSERHNRTRTARKLGIDRATLYRKMWKYGIVPPPVAMERSLAASTDRDANRS